MVAIHLGRGELHASDGRTRLFATEAVDAAAALIFTVAGVCVTTGVIDTGHPHGGLWAGIAVVPMTMPVLWARRAPIPAAAVQTAATVANWLLVGSMVRCGAALPAAFWVAFMVGLRASTRAAAFGVALVCAGVTVQTLCDPDITPPALIGLLPLAAGFCVAGRICRAREQDVALLAERNAQIAAHRERTAQLAVRTDRARISDGLDELIRQRIGQISATAVRGRADVVRDPDAARAALASIAQDGRDTLARMREVVAALREDAATAPLPSLDALADLVAKTGRGRLRFVGARRGLPAGVELSGYRVVEYLLSTLADAGPHAVQARFEPDALELQVSGPDRPTAEPGAVAAAEQRVSLHGGSLVADRADGETRWLVRLPLRSGDG